MVFPDDAKTERQVQKLMKSRNRISLKCGCQFKVYAHSSENDAWEIRTSALHTNGCVPSPAFAATGERARGLQLDAATVASLKVALCVCAFCALCVSSFNCFFIPFTQSVVRVCHVAGRCCNNAVAF